MVRQVLQRLLLAVPVLLGVLLIGFLLMQVVPNDPAVVRAGPTATMDVIEGIRRDLGLDKPLWIQFGLYLGRLLRGDLGVSIINNIPVAQELGNTIGPTLERQTECQEGVDAAREQAADEGWEQDAEHGANRVAIACGDQTFGRGKIAGLSAKASGETTWMSPPLTC